MKKNKGFTLVEVLSVILAIGLIALITTPLVIDTINDVSKGSFKRTAEGILRASEIYYTTNQLNISETITFECNKNSGDCILTDSSVLKNNKLNTNGNVLDGQVFIDSDGNISFKLTDTEYCASKNANNTKITITDGNCEN